MSPLVTKLWPYVVILGLVAGAGGYVYHSGYRSGKQAERAHVADSVSKVFDDSLKKLGFRVSARSDSIKHDTLRIRGQSKLVYQDTGSTHWLHDTVYVAGDTTPRIAVPVAKVAAADSALRACNQYVSDCEARDQLRLAQIATLTHKANLWDTQAHNPPRSSCVLPAAVGVGVGAGALALLEAAIRR